MLRLQKYLAQCGVASRREAEDLIRAGRVKVNGVVAMIGQSVEPDNDRVQVNGRQVARERHVYLVLNKPPGMLSTVKDSHGRPTVMDCFSGLKARVYPVGRLDQDVRGVLLFTNDGEMANRLLHPAYGVEKVYVARVKGLITQDALHTLATGVMLEDGKTAPAKVQILEGHATHSVLRLTLTEGKKREVKRMCAAVGHPVLQLRRIAFANINAKGLPAGGWRHLSNVEVAMLRKLTR